MMCLDESEFDRYARFKSHGFGQKKFFGWEENVRNRNPNPIVSGAVEIISRIHTIQNRIKTQRANSQKTRRNRNRRFSRELVCGVWISTDENGKAL